MKKEVYHSRDVDRLMQKLRDDALTPADERDLQEIIRHHPVARRRFARQLAVDSQLKEALEVSSISLPAGESSSGMKGWLLVAGIMAVVAGILFLAFRSEQGEMVASGEESPAQLQAPQLEAGIAVVGPQVGAEWEPALPENVIDRAGKAILKPGVIRVKTGVLQLDFFNGARVLVSGPATLDLMSPDAGKLLAGKMSVFIPPAAKGFLMMGPQEQVIRGGTDFALLAEEAGLFEVHVIGGEAQLSTSNKNSLSLIAGEAARVTADTEEWSKDQAKPELFPSSRQLNDALASHHEEWKKLRDRIRADREVVLYYTFDRGLNWVRNVPNEAANAVPGSDGAVVGCHAVEGRWPRKKALGFENSSNRLRLNLPGEFRELTLAAWLKIEKLHSPRISILNPQTNQDRYIHWSLSRTPRDWDGNYRWHQHFSETHQSADQKGDRNHYHSDADLSDFISDKKWFHLALVYHPETKEVRHYANGIRVHTSAIKEARPLGIGIADMGNWPYMDWAEGTEFEVRYLNGAMDEFLIAKRAFTDDEIREVYQSGKP